MSSSNASDVVTAASLKGMYTISAVFDANLQEIALPEGTFSVKLSESPKEDENKLLMSVKVGNSMRTSITLLPATTSDEDGKYPIQIGGVIGTRMMPPRDLYALERALTSTLPQLNRLEVVSETQDVVLSGSEGGGKVICSPQIVEQ